MRFRGVIDLLRLLTAMLVAALAGLSALAAAAHEIPTDVKINAFVRPAGNRLELLIRVPLGRDDRGRVSDARARAISI